MKHINQTKPGLLCFRSGSPWQDLWRPVFSEPTPAPVSAGRPFPTFQDCCEVKDAPKLSPCPSTTGLEPHPQVLMIPCPRDPPLCYMHCHGQTLLSPLPRSTIQPHRAGPGGNRTVTMGGWDLPGWRPDMWKPRLFSLPREGCHVEIKSL